MQKVSKDGKIIKYVENPKDVAKYLPKGQFLDFSIQGNVRVFDYGDKGIYKVEPTDKVKGTYSGNICQICEAGILSEYGGCATCNNCGAQLKCGL